jgi:hypothetical protein
MAEWAQLKGGPPPHGLEPGHWYLVESRTESGVVRVLGPHAVGVVLDTASLRIMAHKPDMITRVQGTHFQPITSGKPPALLSFYGVCPKGHRLGSLSITDDEARCPLCNLTYRVEDEEHF